MVKSHGMERMKKGWYSNSQFSATKLNKNEEGVNYR